MPGVSGRATPPAGPRRAVIFTGDDFGLSPAVNQAVVQAHRHGVLTCASLMASGPAAAEALALAAGHPELCLGVHLTLVQGRAALPPAAIPALVDTAGNFRNDPVAAGLYYFFAPPRVQRQLYAELAAQIDVMCRHGRRPWFVNGHLNIHLHPRIWPLVVRLLREYDIPAVRLTREALGVTLALNRARLAYKVFHAFIFAWLAGRVQAETRRLGLKCNDHLFGLLNDGRMDENFVLGLLPRLAPGVTEIYFHPALAADAELRRWTPSYRHRDELAALLSPRLKQALAAHHLEPITFRQL